MALPIEWNLADLRRHLGGVPLARIRLYPPPGMATAAPPAGCDCGPRHWWDPNRRSCVTGACDVPNMPDGDKGGGYFAWHGSLFINTPCLTVCRNLDKMVATGQPGWILVSSPGVTTPKAPVVVSAYTGWGTVPGASWVSVHNGGGVGIGYSLHAGQVTVADGTDAMARRIERVLTNDPGIGVARHVDAGYKEAAVFAEKKDIQIPMRDVNRE